VKWDAQAGAVANHDGAYAFSPRLNTWRHLAPLPQPVRGLAAVMLDERRIYLAGGAGKDGFTDWSTIYDLKENRYLPAPVLPYRAMVALVRNGDYVYCIGGEDRAKHRSETVYRAKIAELRR
jgi:N-acetylneuraminic acid mutarotase